VVWGEQNPALCWETNVRLIDNMLSLVAERASPPWMVFASSREVYGQASDLPVSEDAEFAPLNTYARSKVEGEKLVMRSADAGLRANICRMSSVYGSPYDHSDRVVMAFAGAAARGGKMRVEGASNTFDFTHVDDVVSGIWRLIELTSKEGRLPPVHFVSGRGTSLMELAELAANHARRPVWVEQAAPRDFDVGQFVGNPSRALRLLGWRAETDLSAGLGDLIESLAELAAVEASGMNRASFARGSQP
jgi:nucleoside-diphosphate-sugar epimerase